VTTKGQRRDTIIFEMSYLHNGAR